MGVNWYEAMAYAAWLARVTGKPYRLPTEAEWEWAARRSSRRYPWGDEWDADRCNWQGSRLNRANPVGVYVTRRHRGRSARTGGQCLRVDIQPLSGLSLPCRRWPGRGGGRGTGALCVAARGTIDKDRVRCAYRYWNNPRDGNNDDGFRLARTLSLAVVFCPLSAVP